MHHQLPDSDHILLINGQGSQRCSTLLAAEMAGAAQGLTGRAMVATDRIRAR
jgi:hypothetical protein